MKKLRLLVINSIWPHPSHSALSANVVIFELIKSFAQQSHISVGFLKVQPFGEADPTPQEEEGISLLQELHVEILPPLKLPKSPSRSKWRRVLSTEVVDFYSAVTDEAKELLQRRVESFKPSMIFIPWSEWVTALAADLRIPKYAYYGNPDHKSHLARTLFERTHSRLDFLHYVAKRLMAHQLEKIHVREMMKYDLLGDVAANDVEYYQKQNHPNAFYIQHVWIPRFSNFREERTKREQMSPAKIVGSIGRLSATANTHGLEILGRDFMPILRKALSDIPFEIHIFGLGDPHPAVAPLLSSPEIRIRGFVQDIDAELLSAPIFLCLNNASAYKVGHTRYFHAWSLGSCVIAHRDASLSLPEIVHGKNALLGRNLEEIAELTKLALSDAKLRAKIGEGGYQTFKDFFTAENVVPKILDKMLTYLNISDHTA